MTDEELDALVIQAQDAIDRVKPAGILSDDAKLSAALFALYALLPAITALRSQLADASTRIAAMESGDWSEVKLVRFENGQMDISAGPIPVIAEYLAQMMQDGEGKYFNYMEMTFDHKIAGQMTLSLQRKNGKTPNQLRKEAEARADRAKADLQAMTLLKEKAEKALNALANQTNPDKER